MSKTKEPVMVFEQTGNSYIDTSLARIGRRISEKQTFGYADIDFVEFVLSEKLNCQTCLSAMLCLYLHVRARKNLKISDAAWRILEIIYENRRKIGIPEIPALPLAFVKDSAWNSNESKQCNLSKGSLACAVSHINALKSVVAGW